MLDEKTINSEVRIRMLERIVDTIDRRFEHLESKIDAKFNLIIGIFIASVITPIVLHAFKLI